MPSPRWPMRSMTRRSTTRRPKQEFPVAVATRNRGRHDARHRPAERSNQTGGGLTDLFMQRRVAHDAFAEPVAADLELRLDQSNEPGGPREQHIDRVDALGAAGEQHLRKAAGRGADIEADVTGRIKAEMVERGCELHAAA